MNETQKKIEDAKVEAYKKYYAPYSLDDNGNRVEPSTQACEFRSWDACWDAAIKFALKELRQRA